MYLFHFIVIGQIVVSFFSIFGLGLGIDSLCSCANPIGVCSLLCPPAYNNPMLINRTPIYGMAPRNILQQQFPRKRLVYLQRPTENIFPSEKNNSICSTFTEVSYTTLYKTKTRHTLRVLTKISTVTVTKKLPVTVERINKITLTPDPVTTTVSEIDTLRITLTETKTKTLPAVTQPVTYKSIRLITPEPRTKTEHIRIPPSIYVKTTTLTTTLPPNTPILITHTKTKKITVTETAEPTLYKDYVNIKPLPDNAGIILEFHDSNNKVKTVNVVMPTPAIKSPKKGKLPSLFSDDPKKTKEERVTITVQKNITKNNPQTITETNYITKQNPIFITKVDYLTQTTTTTHTHVKYLTKTKNKIITEIVPEIQTKTVIVPKKTTLVEISTLPVHKHVVITHTKTETTKKTVPTTLYTTRTITKDRTKYQTQTIQTNRLITQTKTETKTITEKQYITVPTTITRISQKNITQIKTETETTTKTKYITVQTPQAPLPTVDRSKQYKDIISDLRRKLDNCKEQLEIANQKSDAYHTEANSLRSLLSHH